MAGREKSILPDLTIAAVEVVEIHTLQRWVNY